MYPVLACLLIYFLLLDWYGGVLTALPHCFRHETVWNMLGMGGGGYILNWRHQQEFIVNYSTTALCSVLTHKASRVLTLTEMWAVINRRPVSKFPIKIELHVFGFNGIGEVNVIFQRLEQDSVRLAFYFEVNVSIFSPRPSALHNHTSPCSDKQTTRAVVAWRRGAIRENVVCHLL